MGKVIVSHYSPDLDSITSIWILMRFAGYDDAELQFVSAGSTLNDMAVDSDPDTIHVDTGLGMFDHHQDKQNGKNDKCAARLVADVYTPKNWSVNRIVEYVNLIDNGKISFEEMVQPFSVVRLIRGMNICNPRDSKFIINIMLPCLDAWYESTKEEEAFYKEFENRLEFQTDWGLGIALKTDVPAAAQVAYSQGAVLFVYQGSTGALGITAAPSSNVNLSDLFENLQKLEPNANWFLHPSKKMLLCGSKKVRDINLSRLQLMDIVKLISKQKPVI